MMIKGGEKKNKGGDVEGRRGESGSMDNAFTLDLPQLSTVRRHAKAG